MILLWFRYVVLVITVSGLVFRLHCTNIARMSWFQSSHYLTGMPHLLILLHVIVLLYHPHSWQSLLLMGALLANHSQSVWPCHNHLDPNGTMDSKLCAPALLPCIFQSTLSVVIA